MREHAVARLVAARGDADDALRAGAERGYDAGDARRIPRAEIEIALELQLGVEIDDAARLARRRLGVRLRAAALERSEGDGARGQRLREALGDVFAQRRSSGPAPQPASDQRTTSTDQRAHVHPPMNGSASIAVSRNAFMMSMKNAPESGTIR